MNTPALVGANALVEENYPNLFLPDRLWAAKPSGSTCVEWLSYLMAGEPIRKQFASKATGTSGTMKNLSKGDVLSAECAAPKLPEQRKIAEFIMAVDRKLKCLRRERP
jgi:type I restriction enzyme S subunit